MNDRFETLGALSPDGGQDAGLAGDAALRDSELRFRATFEQAAVGLAHVAPDGSWLRVNEKLCAIVGYSREELLARTFQDITHPEDLDKDLDFVRRMLAGEIATYSLEKRYIRKDGAQVWVNITISLVGRGDGTPHYFIAVIEDIQPRKLAEWRLRHLAQVVERIAGVHDLPGLMAIVRRAARELTGADGATLVLRDGDKCHYADEDAIGPLWKGQRFPLVSCISGWVMMNARPVAIEDIYLDGRIPHEAYRPTFVKSLAMVPIGRDQPVGAIGCYWASSHQASAEELELQQALADAAAVGLANLALLEKLQAAKQAAEEAAEEVLRLNASLERRVEERTAELQAANRELDSFAHAVSHDLRAPLRAVSGFSEALAEDFGDQLPEEAREYMGQIIQANQRMGGLIDGLLALSRSTRSDLERREVDLSALAERILGDLAGSEPQRSVAWEVEPGLKAYGDARMLEAVIQNLLGNAWKYTASTERPVIRFYREELSGKRQFCVSDNGAGFDMAHAGRLYRPFQRLHRQDEFPGIGIGLATVQRIVHRHGGEIEASAAPGAGAVFRFTLPVGGPGGDEA